MEAQEGEHGGGDVAQAAAWAEDTVGGVWLVVDEDEGDGVGGVGGVGASGQGVDEHLGVAVIGGDEERSSALLHCLVDAA